jgi:hypothetical protein
MLSLKPVSPNGSSLEVVHPSSQWRFDCLAINVSNFTPP